MGCDCDAAGRTSGAVFLADPRECGNVFTDHGIGIDAQHQTHRIGIRADQRLTSQRKLFGAGTPGGDVDHAGNRLIDIVVEWGDLMLDRIHHAASR